MSVGPFDSVEALLADMRARDAAIDAWIASLPGEPAVEMANRFDPTETLLVSRDPSRPGAWRITRFDQGEAIGHCDRATWREAVLGAIADWHGDYANAVVHAAAALPPECSICRRRHGREIEHACE